MLKKRWTSTIVILAIFTTCIVSGADNKNDVNEIKVEMPLTRVAPTDINISPIKVLPVEVNVQPRKPLSVKVQNTVKVQEKWSLSTFFAVAAAITTAVAAIAACFTACFAKKAIKTTKDLADAKLFTKLIEEYSSSEMHDDLSSVFEFYKNDKTTAKAIFKKAKSNIENNNKLNKARRHVTHYFLKILDLKKAKCIKKEFVKKVCDAINTKAIYLLFPLECAKIESINKENEQKIKKEFGTLEKKFNELLELSNEDKLRDKLGYKDLDELYRWLSESNS